jgi:hypothetical protein
LRTKVTKPDGSSYINPTWFDRDIATNQFKEAVFDQRRDSVARILWQLKQDIDHHNEFDNPDAEYQTTFNFIKDMEDFDAGRLLILETEESEEYDEEEDDATTSV